MVCVAMFLSILNAGRNEEETWASPVEELYERAQKEDEECQ